MNDIQTELWDTVEQAMYQAVLRGYKIIGLAMTERILAHHETTGITYELCEAHNGYLYWKLVIVTRMN